MSDQPNRPIYLWVEKYIKKWIAEGVYLPGDKILSERNIALDTHISRATVRKAIDNLIAQQVLERRSSSGTYVKENPFIARHIGIERPLGLSERLKRVGSQASSTLLHFTEEKPTEKIAARLAIEKDEPVLKIKRLRLMDCQAICIETTYLPKKLAPDLFAEDLVTSDVSLYRLLEDRYALSPDTSMESLRITYATEEEAGLLDIKPMDPVLLMRCITYDSNRRPFEYLVSVNHPDRVVFESYSTHSAGLE